MFGLKKVPRTLNDASQLASSEILIVFLMCIQAASCFAWTLEDANESLILSLRHTATNLLCVPTKNMDQAQYQSNVDH